MLVSIEYTQKTEKSGQSCSIKSLRITEVVVYPALNGNYAMDMQCNGLVCLLMSVGFHLAHSSRKMYLTGLFCSLYGVVG